MCEYTTIFATLRRALSSNSCEELFKLAITLVITVGQMSIRNSQLPDWLEILSFPERMWGKHSSNATFGICFCVFQKKCCLFKRIFKVFLPIGIWLVSALIFDKILSAISHSCGVVYALNRMSISMPRSLRIVEICDGCDMRDWVRDLLEKLQ